MTSPGEMLLGFSATRLLGRGAGPAPEDPMRVVVLALTVVLAVQGGVPKSDSARARAVPLDSLRARLARRCVPTAPMPIAGFRARPPETMPVARPDPIMRDSAMVIRIVPCYLVDSVTREMRRR